MLFLKPGMIDKETIDRIMEAARIEEIIGEYVHLKRAGSSLKGLSPFNDEKTPSFIVSPAKQIFKDFSSSKGGNVVTFLMEVEHMSYPEALRHLAEKYQIEIKEENQSPEEMEMRSERESLYIVSKFAEDFFIDELHNQPEGQAIGLSYFRERGFSDQTIQTFKLGYSPDKWDAFLKAADQKGYKEKYLLQTGLVKSGNNNKKYDGFKGRVIFPIHNLSGRAIGFGARTLKTDKKIPKYLNSPESDIYHKSNILYGMYQAKSEIIKNENCFLVEGYTDVISFHQAGIKNVVASSGTSLTEGQIRIIKRYTDNVTILYDGDNAGIKASFRGINLILEQGLNVKVVLFPEGEDPDSFSKKLSQDELSEFVTKNAKDFIVFKTDLLIGETKGDPIKKAALIHEIVESIALIPDLIARSVYVKECSNLLDIQEKALIEELNKTRKKHLDQKSKRQSSGSNPGSSSPSAPPPDFDEPPPEFFLAPDEMPPGVSLPSTEKKSQTSKADHQETDVIRLLLNYGENPIEVDIINEDGKEERVETPVSHYIIGEILEDELEFENKIYQIIFDEYLKLIENEEKINISHFVNNSDQDIARATVDMLTSKYELHDWESKNIFVQTEEKRLFKAAQGTVYSFKTIKINQLIERNQELMKNAFAKGEDVMELLKTQKKLDEVKRQLATEKGITILK